MTETKDRPIFLAVLCIISFVGLGFSILSNFVSLAFLPFYKDLSSLYELIMEEAINDIQNDAPQFSHLFEGMFSSIIYLFNHMSEFLLISLLCSAIAIYGVFMMWQLKKTGFYLYSGAKILAFLFPLFLLEWSILSWLIMVAGLIFTGAFIVLYGLNLKHLE